MIMGSFDRLATETAHDHEVTRTRRSRGRLWPVSLLKPLGVPALLAHFRDQWYLPPRPAQYADTATVLLELNAVRWWAPAWAARPQKTGLRPHRHHQHHALGAPSQPERHETPDPVRSNALESRFHCVR